MLRITYLCFALLTATAASAAAPGFMLGIGYSQDLYFPWWQGVPTALAAGAGSSFILKLTPDGKTVAYLAVLGFQASAMAVDSAGSAYIAGPDSSPS